MPIQIVPKERQGYGQFNGGQIIENKPIGFPQDGGEVKPYSSLFYWAYAEAVEESTIGLHPHQGFEIMSFVLKGAIRHYDTKLKEWRRLEKGDAQIIRAGQGISHAEHMEKGSAMFQIWVDPNLGETMQKPASYDDYKSNDFPKTNQGGIEVKTYVGPGSTFHMDAKGVTIAELSIEKGKFKYPIEASNYYSVYLMEGDLSINGEKVTPDAFVKVEGLTALDLESNDKARIFIVATPQKLGYKTYVEMMQERMAR